MPKPRKNYAEPNSKRVYPAPVEVPEGRIGWWNSPDLRPRCTACGKVAFDTLDGAAASAAKATERGTPMHAYQGPCGNFHTARTRK